LKTIFANTID